MTYTPPPTFGESKEANDAARRNLESIATALNGLDEYWWIEAGTFLGCYRNNGKFIGHDTDIDIGILGDHDVVKIIQFLAKAGFTIRHTFGKPGKGLEIAVEREGVKADLFFFYEDFQVIWMGAWRQDRMIRMEFEKAKMFPLTVMSMEGIMVPTPDNPGYYVRARYGPDWEKPTSVWRWDIDPFCINWEKSEWTKEELLTKWPNG